MDRGVLTSVLSSVDRGVLTSVLSSVDRGVLTSVLSSVDRGVFTSVLSPVDRGVISLLLLEHSLSDSTVAILSREIINLEIVLSTVSFDTFNKVN